MTESDENVLEVEGLRKLFPIRAGLFNRVVGHVHAVDGVSFHIRQERRSDWSARAAAASRPSARRS